MHTQTLGYGPVKDIYCHFTLVEQITGIPVGLGLGLGWPGAKGTHPGENGQEGQGSRL